jgi:hypothetical protein
MNDLDAKRGTAATVAIVLALACYLLLCSGHPVWALICSLTSIPAGLVGLAMAASPRVTGGILSLAAMLVGVVGVVLSILGIIGTIAFKIF